MIFNKNNQLCISNDTTKTEKKIKLCYKNCNNKNIKMCKKRNQNAFLFKIKKDST